jgi:tRNA(Ile)-lysidine synthase
MTLLAAVRDLWLSLGDPPPGLVVAVSGGPDSVALARALAEARPASVPLVVAHLNHQLRGEHSDLDESFVAGLALTLPDVRLVTHRIDVAQLAADRHDNLEAVARRERYRWLAGVARAHGLAFVATGHTASDQAETVLFRLLRGSGIDGLRGISLRRELEPGVEVVRPLLSVTRDDVLAYLRSISQDARHDASNDDPRFVRNRIRHELLPLLARDYNPRVVEVLSRLAAQAAESAEEAEAAASALLKQAERPRAGALVILDAAVLCQAPGGVLRGALRLVWRREGWPMGEMGFAQWRRLEELARAEEGALDLPGGVRARRQRRVLRLGLRDA